MADSEPSKRDSVWSQFHSPILENATAVELEAGFFQEKARQVEIRKVRQSIEEMSMLLAEMQHIYQSSSSKESDHEDAASISDEYISAIDAVSPTPNARTQAPGAPTAAPTAPAAEQPPLNTVSRKVPHIQTTPQRDSLRASLVNSPQREAARRLSGKSPIDNEERKHQHSRGHAFAYAQQTRRPREEVHAPALQGQHQGPHVAPSQTHVRPRSELRYAEHPRSEQQQRYEERPRSELRYEERPKSSGARRRDPRESTWLREPMRERDPRELREPLREVVVEPTRRFQARDSRDHSSRDHSSRDHSQGSRGSKGSKSSSNHRRTEFSKHGLEEQLQSGDLSIADLDLPSSERKLLEKFITALSKLSIEVQMDEAKRHEGRRRMNIALSALEGWL